MRVLQDVKDGVSSLAYWLPVIWKDQDWDMNYLFIILRHKLKAMHARWTKLRRHVSWKRDAHNMRVCILLLDRLIADNYWSLTDMNGRTNGKHGDLVRQNDARYLFRLMGKHVLGWWD